MEILTKHRVFEGEQLVIQHRSVACDCDMTFAVYLPPQAKNSKVPVLWWLSGLTCTHENAMVKAGLQAHAAKYGIAIIFPDTSPRGDNVPNDDAYDLGQGAGFYLDATEAPWTKHFQMYSYITDELSQVLAQFSELDLSRQSISGHSMGGHGALTIGMKNPDMFRSISAFSPITNPTTSDEWGRKQFTAYLGADETKWAQYDACELIKSYDREILIDQGDVDNFWGHLQPNKITEASNLAKLRIQKGYDHSYFFISTFAEEHIKWHSERLT